MRPLGPSLHRQQRNLEIQLRGNLSRGLTYWLHDQAGGALIRSLDRPLRQLTPRTVL